MRATFVIWKIFPSNYHRIPLESFQPWTMDYLLSYFLRLIEKTKGTLESENAEITADLQRISQQKQEGERKMKNMEAQLNELNATRLTQDDTLTRLDANLQKAQRECDNLNQQLEEIEGKAATLEVGLSTSALFDGHTIL